MGYQAVQAAHAAIEFQHQFPEISKQWNENSKYLVMLSVHDEIELCKYLNIFTDNGLSVSVFWEPDIGNEMTALAVEPSDKAKKLCSNLPLMLKEYEKKI